MKKSMLKLMLLALVFGVSFSACKKKGCTNAQATNYDAKAKKDDGSCVMPEVKPQTTTTAKPKTDKKPTKPASKSTNSDDALSKFAGKNGKSTSKTSKTGDNKGATGSSKDVKYKLGAYGWVVDADGYSSPDEIVVLVIADDEDIIYIDAVLTDDEGYYEFDWTLTQDGDLPPPAREMVIFTYDDAIEDICDMGDDFDYYDFDEISDTEYDYGPLILLECD